MSIKLGVIMDPIGSINYKKDSTLAMLLAAQKRGWTLSYMEQADCKFRLMPLSGIPWETQNQHPSVMSMSS